MDILYYNQWKNIILGGYFVNFNQLIPFIESEEEEGYRLNLWQPMMKQWDLPKNRTKENEKFEQFLSKMMEMERACVEEGDDRPVIFLRKNLQECKIDIIKRNGEKWTYILHPFGYNENWEIFDVIRGNKKE